MGEEPYAWPACPGHDPGAPERSGERVKPQGTQAGGETVEQVWARGSTRGARSTERKGFRRPDRAALSGSVPVLEVLGPPQLVQARNRT